MSEHRTVGPSFFLGCILLFVTMELWAIADRLMDIRDVMRAAIATEARRAETTKIGSVHEGAGRQASPKTSSSGADNGRS